MKNTTHILKTIFLILFLSLNFLSNAQDSLKVDEKTKKTNQIGDTIYELFYFKNGQISKLTKDVNKNKNKVNIYHNIIFFYEDGKVSKFIEDVKKYDKSQSYYLNSGFSYEINTFGDTNLRTKHWTKSRTEEYFTYIEFDDKKDTLRFGYYHNVKKEGLEIMPAYSYYINKNNVPRMKIIWVEDKIKDILTENLIYTTSSGKLISENKFIELFNKLGTYGQWEAYLVNINPNTIEGEENLDSPDEHGCNFILLTFYKNGKYIKDKRKVVEKWLKQNSKKQKKTLSLCNFNF